MRWYYQKLFQKHSSVQALIYLIEVSKERVIQQYTILFCFALSLIVTYHKVCGEMPALKKPPGAQPAPLYLVAVMEQEPPQEPAGCC